MLLNSGWAKKAACLQGAVVLQLAFLLAALDEAMCKPQSVEGSSEVALGIYRGAYGMELSDDEVLIVETEYEQSYR